MPEETKEEVKTEYNYTVQEVKLLAKREKRFTKMLKKKQSLGIDNKCDRMDALFTPHLTGLTTPTVEVETSDPVESDQLFPDTTRKSMPLAFEKITTAQSLLVKQNPKGIMHPTKERYAPLSALVVNVYYDNFSIRKKKIIMRKYVYQLAKYGIAYWREYIKRTYKKRHIEETNNAGESTLDDKGQVKMKTIWVYDIFDVVGENVHPSNIILDDSCWGVKDVNHPANDCIIQQYYTGDEFKTVYPEDKFPNVEFVKSGQGVMVDNIPASDDSTGTEGEAKIQVDIYENVSEGLRETWANKIPIESVPLPGEQLSVNGDKWVEDRDDYDGIGVGQILELYQPIADDIVNASLERVREIVRPQEDWFNGLELTDESDDIDQGAGHVRKFRGSADDLKYNRPPPMTAGEQQEKKELFDEIDRVTMLPKNLAGTDDAKTAYQSAQNRESALSKLSIPMDAIKKTIEDAANTSLPLFKIAYSEPLYTEIMSPGDDEFDEAWAIYQKDPNDSRVTIMDEEGDVEREDKKPNKLSRRHFRQSEMSLAKLPDEKGKTKGMVVETDETEFWEMIPEHFNWEGRIEIIGASFLPTSKVLEDEMARDTIEFLLNVPVRDEMGNFVLTDAAGQPFTIDKVKLIKERVKINPNFDPDRFIVPVNQQNANQGNMGNETPLNTPDKITSESRGGNPSTQKPTLKQPATSGQ